MNSKPNDQESAQQLELATVDVGTGPVILFVHGFPLDHTMWQHQIDDLASDFRVVAPDLPGFGLSQPISEPVSLSDYADSLALLLDQLEIDQPVVFCGLSMGGYIGWQFLRRYREKVAALVASDTRSAADDEKTARGRRVMASQVRTAGSASIAADMVKKLCSDHTAAESPQTIEQLIEVISQTDSDSIAAAQLAMAERPDATPWLSEIDIPTLFVVGEDDVITPPAEMQKMADVVANSQIVQLEHAGHMAPLESPAAFNTALRNFLNSTLAEAP